MKALSTDIVATIRDWVKAYVDNNRFDTTYIKIDARTGQLQAQQDANLKFTLGSDGHLKSEVT